MSWPAARIFLGISSEASVNREADPVPIPVRGGIFPTPVKLPNRLKAAPESQSSTSIALLVTLLDVFRLAFLFVGVPPLLFYELLSVGT